MAKRLRFQSRAGGHYSSTPAKVDKEVKTTKTKELNKENIKGKGGKEK